MKEFSRLSDHHLNLREKRHAIRNILQSRTEVDASRWVPVLLKAESGKKVSSWFLVDTGSNCTIISTNVAAKLNLDFDQTNKQAITGIHPSHIADFSPVQVEMYFKCTKRNYDKRRLTIKTSIDAFIPEPNAIVKFCILGTDAMFQFKRITIDTSGSAILRGLNSGN